MEENNDIDVYELADLLNSDQDIILIDVRNEDEYEEDNLGGILIPLDELPDRLEELEDKKDQDIYVQCRSGARSARAKQYLEDNGFDKVHNVNGGIVAYRENIG